MNALCVRVSFLATLAVLAITVGARAEASHVTTSHLAAIAEVEGLSLSPDGNWVAFQVRKPNVSTNSYETEWRVVASDGTSHARRVADAGTPILVSYRGVKTGIIRPAPAAWSPDNAWIAFAREDGDRVQIWRARRDGSQARQLTHNEGDVVSLVFSRDGKRILFKTQPSRAQVDAALAVEGIGGFLFDNRFMPSRSRRPLLPSDALALALGRFSPIQERSQSIWAYDIAADGERAASEADVQEFSELTEIPKPADRPAFRDMAVRSKAGALAWTEALDPDRQGGYAPLTIVSKPSNVSQPIVCKLEECTGQLITGMWWRDESEVLFVRREGRFLEQHALYAWKPATHVVRRILRTTDLFESSDWDCAIARTHRLICFYETSSRPRRVVAIDLESGRVSQLFDPNPDFSDLLLGQPPRLIEIATTKGVKALSYLVLPPHWKGNDARLPLVIVTYRCSGFLRGVGDEYPVFAFAVQGFAVLCFDVPDSDMAMLERMDWESYVRWSRGPGDPEKHRVQDALTAAVAQLDRMGVVDTRRVGLTGLSFGAETVHFAMFNMRHLTTAIASGEEIGPSSTFLYAPIVRDRNKSWWGFDSPVSARWNRLSLALNATRARAPLLLNVADDELINQLQVFTALKDADRAVEMYVFPEENHYKWQPAHRLAIYNRNIDWMNFWLQGREDADPAKAEQYKRWRAMRVKQCELFKGADAPWYCRP